MLMPPLHSTVVGFTKCCPETMILFLHSRDGKHFKSTAIFHITVFGDNTKTSFFNAQETEVSFKMSIAQCDNKCFFNFAVMVLHFSSNVTSMLKMEIKMGLSSDKYHGNHETKVYRSSTAPDYPKWWKLHGYTCSWKWWHDRKHQGPRLWIAKVCESSGSMPSYHHQYCTPWRNFMVIC